MLISDQEITEALKNDGQLGLKLKNKVYRGGRCPSCERKSVWVHEENPWLLRCDHEGSCQYEETVKERYPWLFENFAKRFPSTVKDPKATAKAYMVQERGFDDPRIQGWYEQGTHKLKNGHAAETVRFQLVPGMTWERIIEKRHIDIDGGGKARIKKQSPSATYSGECWMPPGMTIDKGDEVFIVEGIFCAIAMFLAGHKAVAAISAGNLPRRLIEKHQADQIKWRLAYDDEPGAHKYLKKYAANLEDAEQSYEILLTGNKSDWNDAWRHGRLNDKLLKACTWRGRIFIAKTPKRKAYAMYGFKQFAKSVFEFGDNLYAAKFSLEDFNKANEYEPFNWGFCWDAFNQATNVECISNCLPRFMYVEQDKLNDERQYFFKIKKTGDPQTFLGAFSPNALTDPRAFNLALMSSTNGATFDGGAGELKILRQDWLNRQVDLVQTIPFVGYDESTKSYVFHGFGYHQGKYLPANENGYMKVGNYGIKTTLTSMPVAHSTDFNAQWFNDFNKVFSLNGIAALGFFTASLFARQIKERQQSFCFLEVTGDPDAGKSTLIRFLWKLLGRDNFEGIDLLSTSEASYGRHLGKVSNLPVVIIESDRELSDSSRGRPAKSANWDIFKKVYDLDGVIDSRGVKTNDNKTNDRVFRGTIVISQNATVHASPAMLSRIVHLHCTTAHKRPENRPLADALKQMPVEQLAGYMHQALTQEAAYLERYHTAFETHRQTLSQIDDITQGRVVDCHAQAMAAVEALQVIIPNFTDQQLHKVLSHLVERAYDRQNRLSKDHAVVEQFWDAYHFINDQIMLIEGEQGDEEKHYERLNHSPNHDEIAINLNEYIEHCRKRGQEVPNIADLKQLLPTSQRYPFVGTRQTRSTHSMGGRPRCWVFKRKGGVYRP